MGSQSDFYTIVYVLFLRLKIALRFLKELGWIRSILVGVTLAMFLVPLLGPAGTTKGGIYVGILFLAMIGVLHLCRSDHFFIQSLGIKKYKLFSFEYSLAAIPFLMLCLYNGAWLGTIILIPGSLIMAFIPVSSKAIFSNKKAYQFPFALSFEWSSGLRRQKWPIIIILVLGLVTGWWNLFAGWIFLFLITTIAVTFYSYCEPRQFIFLFDQSLPTFIGNKMLRGIFYYLLGTAVLWVELLIFHSENALYSLLFLLGNLGLLLLSIAGKYAFYREHENIEVMIAVIFCIGSIFLLVPYLVPAFFLLLIWLVWRGAKRLRREVYDFH